VYGSRGIAYCMRSDAGQRPESAEVGYKVGHQELDVKSSSCARLDLQLGFLGSNLTSNFASWSTSWSSSWAPILTLKPLIELRGQT